MNDDAAPAATAAPPEVAAPAAQSDVSIPAATAGTTTLIDFDFEDVSSSGTTTSNAMGSLINDLLVDDGGGAVAGAAGNRAAILDHREMAGAVGSGGDVFKHFGFSTDNVVAKGKDLVSFYKDGPAPDLMNRPVFNNIQGHIYGHD